MLEVISIDIIFKGIVAAGGSLVSFLYGGWSSLLAVLIALIIFDYICGMIAAALEGNLSSAIGFKGIAKKVLIFILIAVSQLIEVALGTQNQFIRDAVICFYICNEALSIIENCGRAGLPIPPLLKRTIFLFKKNSKLPK